MQTDLDYWQEDYIEEGMEKVRREHDTGDKS